MFGPRAIRVEHNSFGLCPDGDGPIAKFVPAEDATGEIYDVFAWLPPCERRWWSLHGLAQIVGEPELARAKFRERPITLYETMADWWRAKNRYGVCIASWPDCDPRVLFSGVPEVLCASQPLLEALRQRTAECSRASFKMSLRADGRAQS